jgi:hypothetical protein
MLRSVNFLLTLILTILSLLAAGCADDLRQAAAVDIERTTELTTPPYTAARIWSAPELSVQHYRTLFYGYDTVYYRLIASQANAGEQPLQFALDIDAQYGGNERHYQLARLAYGGALPSQHLRHETLRCQFFNNLVSSCLFRDRAEVVLTRAELEAARQSGLVLTLAAANADYEQIDLPAAYVDGFLRAVQKP